jgi:hypothetical protein
MSAVKGANVTKYDAGASGDNVIGQGLVNAKVEVWTDSYEASALADASTIDIAVLPAGAKVLLIEVYTDAMGTGVTFSVGDSTSATRYIPATSVASAGVVRSTLVDGQSYVIGTNSGDQVIKITTATQCSGTVKTRVYFTR